MSTALDHPSMSTATKVGPVRPGRHGPDLPRARPGRGLAHRGDRSGRGPRPGPASRAPASLRAARRSRGLADDLLRQPWVAACVAEPWARRIPVTVLRQPEEHVDVMKVCGLTDRLCQVSRLPRAGDGSSALVDATVSELDSRPGERDEQQSNVGVTDAAPHRAAHQSGTGGRTGGRLHPRVSDQVSVATQRSQPMGNRTPAGWDLTSRFWPTLTEFEMTRAPARRSSSERPFGLSP